MEIFTNLYVSLLGLLAQNPWVALLGLLTYVLIPSTVTRCFEFLGSTINLIQFTIFGRTFDMATTDWDDNLLLFLRDYVITMSRKAESIKEEVATNKINPDEAKVKLEGLSNEIVQHFFNKAPKELRVWAVNKFGGDKVLAAEYLFARIKEVVDNEKKKVS